MAEIPSWLAVFVWSNQLQILDFSNQRWNTIKKIKKKTPKYRYTYKIYIYIIYPNFFTHTHFFLNQELHRFDSQSCNYYTFQRQGIFTALNLALFTGSAPPSVQLWYATQPTHMLQNTVNSGACVNKRCQDDSVWMLTKDFSFHSLYS